MVRRLVGIKVQGFKIDVDPHQRSATAAVGIPETSIVFMTDFLYTRLVIESATSHTLDWSSSECRERLLGLLGEHAAG